MRTVAPLALDDNVEIWGNDSGDNYPGTTTIGALLSYFSNKGFVRIIAGSATVDPAPINPGEVAAVDITVTGAAIGMPALVVPPGTLEAGLYVIEARVTAADTVTAYVWNQTATAIDPASAIWNAYVIG